MKITDSSKTEAQWAALMKGEQRKVLFIKIIDALIVIILTSMLLLCIYSLTTEAHADDISGIITLPDEVPAVGCD